MREYTVIFQIDVSATSPVQAALLVEDIMKNMIFRPTLHVDDGTVTKLIDLETVTEDLDPELRHG